MSNDGPPYFPNGLPPLCNMTPDPAAKQKRNDNARECWYRCTREICSKNYRCYEYNMSMEDVRG